MIIVTPIGTLVYGNIVEPIERFNKETYTVVYKFESENEAHKFLGKIKKFWTDEGKKGVPPELNTMLKEDENGDAVLMYVQTPVVTTKGKPIKVTLVDSALAPLDSAEYGIFGGDTQGKVSIRLVIYEYKGKVGISRYLTGVKLLSFEPPATRLAFSADEDDEKYTPLSKMPKPMTKPKYDIADDEFEEAPKSKYDDEVEEAPKSKYEEDDDEVEEEEYIPKRKHR